MNTVFHIDPLSDELVSTLQHVIDHKTKPLGALGKLERLALRIGQIQQTLEPRLQNPTVIVFAADHGIVAEGVSAYPQDVTRQMVLNFLAGGAAINVFARQQHLTLSIVDAGIHGALPEHPQLLDRKIAPGTRNFRHEPAMTESQCQQAIEQGAAIVRHIRATGCNILIFGEMGIGNTSSAAVILHLLGNVPLDDCVGRGAGLDDIGLSQKKRILHEAIRHHAIAPEPLPVLATFGGFEIAMMCGAFLQAAEEGMMVVVDGFIVTSALLVAARLYPAVLEYCLFGHLSQEAGHRAMLDLLHADPLLHLDMRLGEGTGAVLAYPLVEAAVNFLNEMASFESAGVSTAS
ncbi:nicotinate-nucleotide--dimethylbenzimidazole phosphoribosyltransferase [candidate division KSB3 bacterium]|uniref:Nicotinate-nucleotide--dimethylbenzimidazole phosphoribosyltransferase n=1 Tax=candidate division KSB3 bacterium TaxID=2044937 RepID=A0A9D5JZI2_9BACT|nr:nicotinate-nucleotide--dimethylbenzimidazole phosphoribosyltransferase [candidate division KSB3 bacterium]MBD3326651.1 nicotinate-nucleotide--dimethylbenzimidazole phosphoribosyltransferase [candidate division KSB3 bacterium]